MTTRMQRLRQLIDAEDILVAPGAYDAITGRLIERAGFDAVYMTGAGTVNAHLGLPDIDLASMTEMAENAARIAAAVSVPVFCDIDTGYGNAVSVMRTIRFFEAAGVAGVHLEDQVSPKRCGFAKGVEVVPRKEAVQRLKAAIDARDEGADILVIGRTDSRKAADLDEALWRCEAFADLGADIVYFEGPESEAEMEALCRRLPDVPKMLAQADRRERTLTTPKRAEAIGFKLALFGITLLSVQVRAMRDTLATIREGGHPGWDRLTGLDELYETVGFDDYYALEKRYAAE